MIKTPIPHLTGWLALAAILPFTVARADDPFDALPKQVGLLVEYYEVDHSALPPLLRDYQKEADATGLIARVREMAEKGEARMVESTYIVTRSGQRAKIESIREFIYPTEWDPAELPQKLTGPVDRDTEIRTPATPTAYERRPIGNTLEIDPIIGADGIHLDLNLAPELVEFHGMKEWGHDVSTTPSPLFHSMKVQTAITTKFGGCELFGVLTPPSSHGKDGEGKRVLGFISTMKLMALSDPDLKRYRENPQAWIDARFPPEVPRKEGADPFSGGGDDAPPPAPEAPRQVSMITEFIEVDAALASRIALQLNETCDASAIRRRLDGVIAKGEARVLETSTQLTRSGQRMRAQSIREFIYPTEYDPPEIPQELHGPIDRDLKMTTSVGATAFGMQPVGVTVEVDPVISVDGRIIELNIAPELVRHIGELTYGTGPSTSEQPLFESLKLQTSVTMPDGTSFLLAMHSLESARAGEGGTEEERAAVRDRRVLVFLTTKIKVVN
jgi:hypothetical protein